MSRRGHGTHPALARMRGAGEWVRAGGRWIRTGRARMQRQPGRRGAAFPALVWLGFILFLIDAVETNAPTAKHLLTIAEAVAFVVAHVWLVLSWRQGSWRPMQLDARNRAEAVRLAEERGWL